MRRYRRTTLAAALTGLALLTAAPPGAAAGPAAAGAALPATAAGADLPGTYRELTRRTAQAERLADALDRAAGRSAGLRVALDRLADARDDAQRRLDARARLVYMRTAPDPVAGLTRRLAAPALRRLVTRGAAAALATDRSLLRGLAEQSAQARALQERSDALQRGLRAQAAPVLAAQERARALLAAAEQAATAARAAGVAAALAQQRARLDAVSASVTAALTPAQTARSRAAQQDQAPLLARLAAAGSGYPEGYRPTGQLLTGVASWYGPGFVGRPTASGAPYDPELPTCAARELPLGTVLRVSRAGRATSCLVNDRGPYVGDRVLDLSRAGSRALGYDGLAAVSAEVLAPG